MHGMYGPERYQKQKQKYSKEIHTLLVSKNVKVVEIKSMLQTDNVSIFEDCEFSRSRALCECT